MNFNVHEQLHKSLSFFFRIFINVYINNKIMNFQTDLKLITVLLVLTASFILLPPLNDSPVRAALVIPMVLFIPGYALVSALFPRRDDLDGIERIALSFGLSVAIVPLIGLLLNYTSWGIRLLPILLSLIVFTLAMVLIAIYRRRSLGDNAFEVPFGQIYASLKRDMSKEQETRLGFMLNLILVLLIVVSALALIYVAIAPERGENFTEFYILGPEGMTANYSTQLETGESVDVIVGIVNHEYSMVDYSLEVQLDNRPMNIPSDFEHISLSHNETREMPLSIVPDDTGDDMKLEYLLYKEGNTNEPYHELHLWIDVTEAGNAS